MYVSVAVGSTHDCGNFLVDSGATRHSVFDDAKFISEDKGFLPHQHTIELADGTKTTGMAVKKGTIEISLKNSEGKVVTGTLDDVLHVPTFPQNIFSVQAATVKGARFNFNQDSSELILNNRTFKIKKKGRLYFINNSTSIV